MKSKKPIVLIALIVIILGLGYWMYQSRNVSANVSEKDLLSVQRVDSFPLLVNASGALEALQSVSISPPRMRRQQGQFKLVRMVEEGKIVEEGDFLMEFDTTSLNDQLRDQSASFQKTQEQQQTRRGNSDDSMKSLRLSLERARSDLEKTEEQLNAQADLLSGIEVEKMRINRDTQRYALEMQEKKYEYQVEMDGYSALKLRSQERLARNRIDELLDAIDLYTVRAPVGGVVIYKRDWNGQAKEIGSSVSAMDVVMEIPELSTMRARIQVDEIDSGRIKIGQDVIITVDAVQGRSFGGKVNNIAAILKQASFDRPQKILEVYVDLTDLDVKTLRPGMSIKAQIRVGEYPQAIVIPMTSIEGREGRSFVQVYNPQTKNIDWREVRLRTNDGHNAVVESGIDAGERILTRPQL